VVLQAQDGQRLVPHPLEGAVIQILVRHLHLATGNGVDPHRKIMILRRDVDFVRRQILHRVVAAVVAELQFKGGAAVGMPQQLMAEADAQHGHVAHQSSNGFNPIRNGGGIAGPVGQHNPIGLAGQNLLRGRRRRHHSHPAAEQGQAAQDVVLDAEIHDDHVVFGLGRIRVPHIRRVARHVLDVVDAGDVRRRADARQQPLRIALRR